MSVLSAQTIRQRVASGSLGIEPFCERSRAHGMSYGLSACGVDLRLGRGLWLFPFWGRLGFVMEHIRMPRDLRGKIENKSTLARRFIDASRTTNAEPGWQGYLTVEITHDRPWPIYLKKGTPIAQIVFEELDRPTDQPYGAGDKYQNQPAKAVKAIATSEAHVAQLTQQPAWASFTKSQLRQCANRETD